MTMMRGYRRVGSWDCVDVTFHWRWSRGQTRRSPYHLLVHRGFYTLEFRRNLSDVRI